jgi:hypothetical protein
MKQAKLDELKTINEYVNSMSTEEQNLFLREKKEGKWQGVVDYARAQLYPN